MRIQAIRTPSLGDTTYVLVHGGAAVVVDPQRDIDRFVDEAGGATISHVLETHVHNDYVSGGRDLAAAAGADLVLPAGSGVGFPFVPAFHLEDLEGDGDLTIRLHEVGEVVQVQVVGPVVRERIQNENGVKEAGSERQQLTATESAS